MIQTMHEFGVETLVDLHQDVLSPYTCGEGMPDWAYLKALDAVGFDRTGDRAFPAPLKLDLPIDEETGYADTRACVQRARVCVCVVAPRGGSALGSCRFERESVASAQRARLLIVLRREERERERESESLPRNANCARALATTLPRHRQVPEQLVLPILPHVRVARRVARAVRPRGGVEEGEEDRVEESMKDVWRRCGT